MLTKESNTRTYNGNDVTTTFDYAFYVEDDTELRVTVTDANDVETLLTKDVDYTMTNSGDETGGTVTYPISGSPLATGERITLLREVAYTQTADIQNQGGFYPETIESALDRLEMQIQQVKEQLGRALQLGVGTALSDLRLPEPGAGYYFRYNSGGTGIELDVGSINSSSYLASGVGAVTRSVNSKLGDIPAVIDYGADNTGVASSDAAFAATVTAVSTGAILVPSGTYSLTSTTASGGATFILMPGVTFTGGGGVSGNVISLTSGQQADSIAQLRLIDGTTASGSDRAIFVRGYYDIGDGGGGWFYWDAASTATDNGGTIIQATGVVTGRWIRVDTTRITDKMFGAYVDGSTDDATATQNAVDYIKGQNDGELILVDGIRVYSTGIKVYPGVTIRGEGVSPVSDSTVVGTRVKVGANTSYVFYMDDTVQNHSITLKDFTVDGNKANYTCTAAIYMSGVNIKLDNLYVQNVSGDGIRTDDTGGGIYTWVNWIQNCIVTGCDGYGLYNQSSDSFFTNNYFSTNAKGQYSQISGGNAWDGNHFDNTPSSYPGLHIVKHASYSNMADRVVNNYFDLNYLGLHVDGGGSGSNIRMVIDNNRFRAQSTYDIQLTNTYYSNVSNCQFTKDGAAASYAINMTGAYSPSFVNLDVENTYTAPFYDTTAGAAGVPASGKVRNLFFGDTLSEKFGSATVTDGNSTTAVTHNLFTTPASVVATSSDSNYDVYVTAITSTTFTLTISPAASGTDVTLYWNAHATQ